MIAKYLSRLTRERRVTTLAAIILAQALCAAFFLGDVVFDIATDGRLDGVHMLGEVAATLALVAGVAFLTLELRRLLARMEHMESGLRAARGEMMEVIALFFAHWSLSPAERDVALLVLKGFDNERIAALRGTATGTVRAQSARVYAKAGVDGRAQFLSLFLDELLAAEGGKPEDRDAVA